MTLFKIAGKNIQKNFMNYFLYFASVIFSIIIYFTFVSLKYDDQIQSALEGSTKISSAFSGAAVVLVIFVIVFIGYSNSFFLRKRKKEVGLYSLLGVRKKQIGRMLFYENFLMGILALIVGIALGSVLSQFFVILLMKMMTVNASLDLSISWEAVMNTLVVFMIITLLTSIQGYRLIYRFKLIELFHADQQQDTPPKASMLTALASIVFIGIGYWLALQNLLTSAIWAKIGIMLTPLIILITVILGTYLLFNTLTVALLQLFRKNKKQYWRGINLIGASQLLFRIKGNARTLTIFAVLSATTLTAVGTAYSFYYNSEMNAALANPNSFMFIGKDQQTVDRVTQTIQQSPEHKLLYYTSVPVLELDADYSNVKQSLGASERTVAVIASHDFNQLAKLQGKEGDLKLIGNEAAALEPSYVEGISPDYVGSSITLQGQGIKETIQFNVLKKFGVLNTGTIYSTLVVSDDMFNAMQSKTNVVNAEAYGITNQNKAKALTKQLSGMLPEEAEF